LDDETPVFIADQGHLADHPQEWRPRLETEGGLYVDFEEMGEEQFATLFEPGRVTITRAPMPWPIGVNYLVSPQWSLRR
jgi:hypothetical protein